MILASHSPLRIAQLRQHLRDLGAKPCHEDRLLRGWTQVCSYDRKHSPAEAFFPLALRNELPAIEAELNGLARLRSEYPANGHGMDHESHDRSPTPPLMEPLAIRLSPQAGKLLVIPRITGEGANVVRGFSDNEGVARLLVELHDGQMVESVLLPRGGLCVSTQVGCAVGCVFCMSGRAGLLRQLGSAEIVAQVVLARRRRAVSKVVFMGMGEPAHNLDNVLEAIELLGTQGNIGHKNLVFSTVGDLRVFERLSHETVKPALALSLHTTDAALRASLLPRAPQIAIEELVERAEAYARATAYPVQYQWTLIEGVNDSDAEVEGIALLLSGKHAVMNFIPFNEVDGLDYRRPSHGRIASMVQSLKRHGILAKIRDSAGQEIEGACGQLRARAVKATDPLNSKHISSHMKKIAPTKDEIALLQPFAGLTLERIHVPTTTEEFAAATAEIKAAGIVGFDTESRPTFVTGDVSEGPHVVQFALHDKAYLFQLHRADGRIYLLELLQSEQLIKVGFGLKSDRGHIYAKLGVHFNAVVDLNTVFRMDGYHKEMGVRAAVGLVFKQRFAKARHVTTSNWSQLQLTPQQMLYAANDAYAALKVLEALGLAREDLPIMGLPPETSGDTSGTEP